MDFRSRINRINAKDVRGHFKDAVGEGAGGDVAGVGEGCERDTRGVQEKRYKEADLRGHGKEDVRILGLKQRTDEEGDCAFGRDGEDD